MDRGAWRATAEAFLTFWLGQGPGASGHYLTPFTCRPIPNSQSLLKLMFIESVMPSNIQDLI